MRRSRVDSPYRAMVIAPTPFAPPLGWTRWATALVLAAMLVPAVTTVAMLAELKNCDGVAVPRWDEAGIMIVASLGAASLAGAAYKAVRRRLARIRTKHAFSSGAWSVLGISPALFGLAAASMLALHFSLEHLFESLCIDVRGLFWHGC